MKKTFLLLLTTLGIAFYSNGQIVNWDPISNLFSAEPSLATDGTDISGDFTALGYGFSAEGTVPANPLYYDNINSNLMVYNSGYGFQDTWLTHHATGLTIGDKYVMSVTIANETQWQYLKINLDGWASTLGTTPSYDIWNDNDFQGSGTGTFPFTLTDTVEVTAPSITFGLGLSGNKTHTAISAWSVTKVINTDNDITAFSLPEQTGAATINTSTHTVNIEVPYNTNRTNLTPTIGVSSGAIINPISGTSGNFNGAVTYTVTAEDGTPQNWTINVTESPARTDNDITSFHIPERTESPVIDKTAKTITVSVDQLADITNLTPSIIVSLGATINPVAGIPLDFSSPQIYTVTAEDGSQENWTVTVNVVNINTAPCSIRITP